ncbi:O-methyltransferase [Solitalea canadensis]|uniref:Putative O-methyltransferase n=1 Tax=Solitalea canadensis (strain ATCC 29591 / DSM 3403 / JCM 21819 / LMG 8368 / NBRC 15130 / NCIMB 12057 / USAM 9D) TaxID=929556 RepID=H8KX71_SOLCM|nr:class I SAM-dependent methyltransferase [Solitalea canadensis]AFD08400.1 putative O-methyltransferase [Solitalea canadensis DSM 3403]
MEIINKKIDAYIDAHTDIEPEVLKILNRETHLKVLLPRMLSGHFQGRVLSMISKMIKPHRILELGTYTGYSAICLSEGLAEEGKLTTIDINAELEPFVRSFFEKAKVDHKIEYIIGDGTQVVPELNELFDLVFIDADKKNNGTYYDLVFDKVKPGGFILIDNVLWSGKVIDENPDKDTKVILAFNEKVQNDERVENVMLPIRDGVLLVRKR